MVSVRSKKATDLFASVISKDEVTTWSCAQNENDDDDDDDDDGVDVAPAA